MDLQKGDCKIKHKKRVENKINSKGNVYQQKQSEILIFQFVIRDTEKIETNTFIEREIKYNLKRNRKG